MGGRLVKPIKNCAIQDNIESQRIFLCDRCYNRGMNNGGASCRFCSSIDLNVCFYPFSEPAELHHNGALFKDSLESLLGNVSCCGLIKRTEDKCVSFPEHDAPTITNDDALTPEFTQTFQTSNYIDYHHTKAIQINIEDFQSFSKLRALSKSISKLSLVANCDQDVSTSVTKLKSSHFTVNIDVKGGFDDENSVDARESITIHIAPGDMQAYDSWENSEYFSEHPIMSNGQNLLKLNASTNCDLDAEEINDERKLSQKFRIFVENKCTADNMSDSFPTEIFSEKTQPTVHTESCNLLRQNLSQQFNKKCKGNFSICEELKENRKNVTQSKSCNLLRENEQYIKGDFVSDIHIYKGENALRGSSSEILKGNISHPFVDHYRGDIIPERDYQVKPIVSQSLNFISPNCSKYFSKELNEKKSSECKIVPSLLKTSGSMYYQNTICFCSNRLVGSSEFVVDSIAQKPDIWLNNTVLPQKDISYNQRTEKVDRATWMDIADELPLYQCFLNTNPDLFNKMDFFMKDKCFENCVEQSDKNDYFKNMLHLWSCDKKLFEKPKCDIGLDTNDRVAFVSRSSSPHLDLQGLMSSYSSVENQADQTELFISTDSTADQILRSTASSSSSGNTSMFTVINVSLSDPSLSSVKERETFSELHRVLSMADTVINELLPYFSMEIMQEFKKIGNTKLFTTLAIVTRDLHIAKSIVELLKYSAGRFTLDCEEDYLSELIVKLVKVKIGIAEVEYEKKYCPNISNPNIDASEKYEFNKDIFDSLKPIVYSYPITKTKSAPSIGRDAV